MINVTKTFLPPMSEFTTFLQRSWDKAWLTNNGELLKELEQKLINHLGVENIIITTNGTLPLQIALNLLGRRGEIITTPFSYVATTSSIVWEGCTPVFVDIHPEYLSIDENKIESAITEHTTAILATHVFGNPCHIEAIEVIAKKHNLYVIYDAAHCFDVQYKGKSVFTYGDVSTCSFHATKLFHTGEGGAMFANDPTLNERLFFSHNFGHSSPTTFYGLGINAKASELQAAMGLAVLPYMEEIIAARKAVVIQYQEELDFARLQSMKIRPGTEWNYSYFPIIFNSEAELLLVIEALNQKGVTPRRYFYPSLNTIDYTRGAEMPISESIASRILCLPLYVGLLPEEVVLIVQTINAVTQSFSTLKTEVHG